MKRTNRLRVCRAERRVTQQDLALQVRIGLNRLWKIENGYTEPADDERQRLADALGVTVADVFPATAASDGSPEQLAPAS